MYVFGRYQYRREIDTNGEVHKRMQAVEMAAWRVGLKQHHEGYITLEEFVSNQERLQKNRTNGEETVLSGPAREGLALLQGLLLCGNCGHALTVRYRGNGGICPTYQCNLLRREGLATKSCMVFRCDLLDGIIAEEMLKALQPAELELALAALQELESRDRGILRQWQMRLERAEYEVALAERRYQEVDPANRLVAGTLERRWNDALLHLDELHKEAAEFQHQEAHVATPEQKAKVLALARDLPRLWNAPTTQSKDRKRMLRLLIKDITVERPANQKQLLVHIRWQGGAGSDVGFLMLKFRGFLVEFLQVKQRIVPAPLQCARYQTVGGIDLLVATFGKRHFIFGASEPHLPLVQDPLISRFQFVESRQGKFQFGRL
jgi:hypothetical protein